MPLTPEEKKHLEALQAKENEPEPDDEYIEIWDDKGAGAKVKRSSAKPWLNKFGIDIDESAPETETEGKPEKKSGSKRPPVTDGNVTHAAKYLGNKNTG
jgi:hypothetical protein